MRFRQLKAEEYKRDMKKAMHPTQKRFLSCERATKRCISGGKNDQKYGIYPFDKLEFDYLFL